MNLWRRYLKYRDEMNRKLRVLFSDRAYLISFLVGFFLLFLGQYITFKLATYNDTFDKITVGDLLLDILPTVNLGIIYTWGSLISLITITLYTLFARIELAPWAMKTFGIFFIVRAVFILLTHLGAPEGMFYLANPPSEEDKFLFSHYFFVSDLFFSGHVGNLFLSALIFRAYKFRWFGLIGSVVMGVTVLFMKIHYTIDVLAAYFITYGVYVFSDRIFHTYNERFKALIEKKTKYKFREPYHPEVKV